MQALTTTLTALTLALAAAGAASAHEQPAQQTVPEHEVQAARRLLADGPRETTAVQSITALGGVVLDDELPGAAGKVLRAREFVLAPGAQIAVHEHQRRPGLAYVLEGELVEHRNDASAPIRRGVGAVAFERNGVVHWWKNESDRPARALVVDIVDATAK
jgi:quercetin dioxygenase-like cupin family protein